MKMLYMDTREDMPYRPAKPTTVEELKLCAARIRLQLLELCTKEVIHIGGDLSIADVMTVLWLYQMKYDPSNPKWEKRDRFVLSKGHASAVTSFAQAMRGCFPAEAVIRDYAKDGKSFSMHSCALNNRFVEVSTGSLGHGFPIACGMAAGLRLKKNDTSRVYVLMGDGEQAEGSVWEAAMNAAHYKLGNLAAIIDCNGFEADGRIDELTAINDLGDKYRAFGWNVCEFDGNDIGEIKYRFDSLPPPRSEKPTVLICRTVKGKGVPFMENQPKWHAGKITPAQFKECEDLLLRDWRQP